MQKIILICTFIFIAAINQSVAATGRILSSIEAEQADSTALVAEADLFQSIGMGIAVSLAQCEINQDCDLSVDHSEIQQLLDTINSRIDALVLRQQQGEEDYSELLTVYADQREKYLAYQQKLQDITGVEDAGTSAMEEEIAPDTFADDTAEPSGETQEGGDVDLSIFEDVGEDLVPE